MKKIIIFLLVASSFVACKKSTSKPTTTTATTTTTDTTSNFFGVKICTTFVSKSGILQKGIDVKNITIEIYYTGAKGQKHSAYSLNSSGVTGLTATIPAGTLANGDSSLRCYVTGTPASIGTASFNFFDGIKNYTFNFLVIDLVKSQINFSSTGSPIGSFQNNITDIDGNSYKTVTIGKQTWMTENLKVTKFNDGTTIPNLTDNNMWTNNKTSAWCYYDNDSNYNVNFGKLYNWYAVSTTSNGNKNVCPLGWHVPTNAEWTDLTDYLGKNSQASMKEVTKTNVYNTDATNTSFFTGLPGGILYGNIFSDFGNNGYWWSSSTYSATWTGYSPIIFTLNFANGGVGSIEKENGLSIRCLKD